MRRETHGFRLGIAKLRRQAFRAPPELGMTLAQLSRLAHQVGALRRDADLLEA